MNPASTRRLSAAFAFLYLVGMLSLLVQHVVAADAPGDVERGRQFFQRNCTACHSADLDANFHGPALGGAYGRTAGHAPGYRYSVAMRAYGRRWTPATLDAFLADSARAVPGTFMAVRIAAPQDRADLIAFLRQEAGRRNWEARRRAGEH